MFRIHNFMRNFFFWKSKLRYNFGTEPLLLLVLWLKYINCILLIHDVGSCKHLLFSEFENIMKIVCENSWIHMYFLRRGNFFFFHSTTKVFFANITSWSKKMLLSCPCKETNIDHLLYMTFFSPFLRLLCQQTHFCFSF